MPDSSERVVRFASKQVKAAAGQDASCNLMMPDELNRRPKTFYRCGEEDRRKGDRDVWIMQSVYRQVFDHLAHDTQREHGGLLLGFETDSGGRPAVVIAHSLPAHHTLGTPVRLEIKEDSWAEWDRIEKSALRSGLHRVGWYHSHPGIRIFLSPWDLDVCRAFERPTDIAMVVDPVNNRGGFFVRGTEGYRPESPQSFYEIHNMFSESVVSWTNVRPEKIALERDPTLKLAAAVDGGVATQKSGEPLVDRPELPKKQDRTLVPGPRAKYEDRIGIQVVLSLVVLLLAANSLFAWFAFRKVPREPVNLKPLADAIANLRADVDQLRSQHTPAPGPSKSAPAAPAPSASAPSPPARLAIAGRPITLKASETYTFKVNGSPPPEVLWSLQGPGFINPETGLYTAPAESGEYAKVKVAATTRSDQKASVTFLLRVTPKDAAAVTRSDEKSKTGKDKPKDAGHPGGEATQSVDKADKSEPQ